MNLNNKENRERSRPSDQLQPISILEKSLPNLPPYYGEQAARQARNRFCTDTAIRGERNQVDWGIPKFHMQRENHQEQKQQK